MTSFVPDTNVWKGVGRDVDLTTKFEHALTNGDKFLIAPPALIELVRGMVRGGNTYFQEDKKTYAWMQAKGCEVLELPRPFVAKVLNTSLPQKSGVLPEHYRQLIDMVVKSADIEEFVKQCNEPQSVWKQVESLDKIHETQVEQELKALETIARRTGSLDLAALLSRTFGTPGSRPDPAVIKEKFSAPIEYLEYSISKLIQGANPRKNSRGLYVDYQLLHYLSMPDVQFLTKEKFSDEIVNSPQKGRIVSPQTLT
jgi:hypothetical protein